MGTTFAELAARNTDLDCFRFRRVNDFSIQGYRRNQDRKWATDTPVVTPLLTGSSTHYAQRI